MNHILDTTPYNVYTKEPIALTQAVLDGYAESCGDYLLYKYCAQEKIFDITAEDVLDKSSSLQVPKELVAKGRKGTSGTVNRNRCAIVLQKIQSETEDELRLRKVAQDKKKIEGLYSKQNTCQAIVNPSCSKYKVMKSVTVPRAVIAAVAI